MDHVADGELGDLARLGARDVGDGDDFGGDVARRAIVADLFFDGGGQGGVEGHAAGQHHEQNDAGVVVPFLADDDAFFDRPHFFDLVVNLQTLSNRSK